MKPKFVEAQRRLNEAMNRYDAVRTEMYRAEAEFLRLTILDMHEDMPIERVDWEEDWEYDDEGGYYQFVTPMVFGPEDPPEGSSPGVNFADDLTGFSADAWRALCGNRHRLGAPERDGSLTIEQVIEFGKEKGDEA